MAGTETQSAVELSIVVPAYNEHMRLTPTLRVITDYLHRRKTSFEIIVVDDGSTDGTAEAARKFSAEAPEVRVMSYSPNRGKGYAVRLGMLNAQGRAILMDDADGSSPIEELPRLEEALRDGADVAIGSRALASKVTRVNTVWYRKFLGRIFNIAANLVLVPGIADTQCGFKLFRREVGQYLFSIQKADRFSFDVEVLFLARKAQYRIAEVAINWHNVPGSKVRFSIDPLKMLLDILLFRWRDLTGQYRSA